METFLRHFQISNPEVTHLRILLHGHTGAGTSSFVNSVESAFQHRISVRAPAPPLTMTSCTKRVKCLAFDISFFLFCLQWNSLYIIWLKTCTAECNKWVLFQCKILHNKFNEHFFFFFTLSNNLPNTKKQLNWLVRAPELDIVLK